MAAPVVQTKNTFSWTANTSPVITKPSGLAEGDLMIAYIGSVSSVGNTVADPSTPAGWTRFLDAFYDGVSDTHKLFGFYKVASAADAAASNFTFVCDTSDAVNSGLLMRVTGQSSVTPHAGSSYQDNGAGLNPTVSVNQSTVHSESLLIMAWLCLDTNITAGTTSGYTVTGITNPTWTEQFDSSSILGDNEAIAIATATSGEAGTITQIEMDFTESGTVNWIGALSVFPSQRPATVTPDSVAVRAVVPAQSPKAKVKITPESVAVRTQISDQTAKARQNLWVNDDAGAGTWTNETI